MAMSMDYAQMVEGCRRRDPKAQRALYDAVSRMSMGICMRYAQGRDEAQDMMQDGFIKVFERIGSLNDADSLLGWVRNIMVNTCIDYHRRRRHWMPIDEVEEPMSNLDTDPFATEEIVAALQQLRPAQRTVFNLCEVEGYKQDEVAKRLKINTLLVRVTLCRAKDELRKILTK